MLKKIICLVCLCVLTSVSAYASEYGNITSNAPITKPQYETARKIILGLQNETPKNFCAILFHVRGMWNCLFTMKTKRNTASFGMKAMVAMKKPNKLFAMEKG